MKTFELKYYVYDSINEMWNYRYTLNMTAKEIIEFLIDNAFNKDVKIYEIKEICK